MATELKLRRGTAAEHATFTGAEGEVTYDTTNKRLRAHDGSTAGGIPVAKTSESGATFALVDGYLDWSVSGNVLTVAVKHSGGVDPAAATPVYVDFRSATAATGTITRRTLTAATSISINDTATLGTSNSTAFRLWAVLFDDGGTVRLGVINCLSGTNIYPLAAWGIASSTAEDNASDSAHVFYTGTAVSSKAYAVAGYATWESGLATAGTWSAGPTRAQLFGPGVPLPGQVIQEQITIDGASASGSTTIPADNTIPQSGEGNQFMTRDITPTSATNILDVYCVAVLGSNSGNIGGIGALFVDSVADAVSSTNGILGSSASTGLGGNFVLAHRKLAGGTSSTTYKFRAGTTSAATTYFNNWNGTASLGGTYTSRLGIKEIMA